MLPEKTQELIARQHNLVEQLVFDLNNCRPQSTEFYKILNEIINHIGENTIIKNPIYFDIGNVSIGNHCFINRDVKFIDFGGITIGNNVGISSNVVLIANDHPQNPLTLEEWVDIPIPIVIKDNAWIGAGAIIKGKVTIGENAIIGAGAVIVKDVPDNAVVVGNPQRIIQYNR